MINIFGSKAFAAAVIYLGWKDGALGDSSGENGLAVADNAGDVCQLLDTPATVLGPKDCASDDRPAVILCCGLSNVLFISYTWLHRVEFLASSANSSSIPSSSILSRLLEYVLIT